MISLRTSLALAAVLLLACGGTAPSDTDRTGAGLGGGVATLYWSEGDTVRRANADGTGLTTLVTGLYPMGVAFDGKGKKVYWADNGTDAISRMNADTTSVETLSRNPDPQSNTDAIAIDLGANTVFWTEAGASVVRSSRLDGAEATTVLTRQVPTGIAVDPVAKKIYWADNGTDEIARSNYDGSAIEVLYANPDPYSNPSSVAVDGTLGRFYFTQVGGVFSANLDGTDLVQVAVAEFPTGVAVDRIGGSIYFSDNGPDAITRVALDGSNRTVIHTNADPTSNPRHVFVAR